MEVIHRSSEARPIDLPGAKSGEGMDRVIEKEKLTPKTLGLALVGVVVAALAGWYLYDLGSGRSLMVEGSRLVISPVEEGLFEDYIPIRSRVTPKKTVYLDVIEGGQVKARLLDDGADVRAGDLIVVLNNTSLQLEVARNEALVTEQLNNMRTIELQLEQNRLQHKRALVQMDYEIRRLTRLVERLANLDDAGVAAKSQLEDAQDELEFYTNSRRVTLESQETDARLQETQLEFLQTSGKQLEANLTLARENLDALNIRAPVDGKLSGLDVEVGQSIQRGGRLGQIDDPTSFKLRAEVDEYYLGRVDLGQTATFEIDRDTFETTVAKIYPQVNDGQFEIDLFFTGSEPEGIRRGQSIQGQLTLGDASTALLIPNGSFFQDTGGNWMFVVNSTGTEANRRSVRLGRRNARHIEVLEGLDLGEEVVTSPYSSFREMDRLRLTDD